MRLSVLLPVALAFMAIPCLAGENSPVFGSSTQFPVIIVVNPATGFPVASVDLPKPLVALRQ